MHVRSRGSRQRGEERRVEPERVSPRNLRCGQPPQETSPHRLTSATRAPRPAASRRRVVLLSSSIDLSPRLCSGKQAATRASGSGRCSRTETLSAPPSSRRDSLRTPNPNVRHSAAGPPTPLPSPLPPPDRAFRPPSSLHHRATLRTSRPSPGIQRERSWFRAATTTP